MEKCFSKGAKTRLQQSSFSKKVTERDQLVPLTYAAFIWKKTKFTGIKRVDSKRFI